MPVWIKRANAELKPSGCAFGILEVVAIIVLGFASSAMRAQSGRPQPEVYDPVPDAHKIPTAADLDRMARNNSSIKPPVGAGTPKTDTCLLPPLDLINTPSIAASQLQIEGKARNEYHKACASLQKKKIADAEKHLRKAVSQSSKYAEAWVTLGQVLTRQRHSDEALRACIQASTVETTYVPAYLCLADIAARRSAWDEVLQFSARAIDLDPANNAIAYEYHAAANLNLHEWSAAEKSGLRALEIDKDHREPRVHFVLAQIYEAKGDAINKAAQLREYLKYAKDPDTVDLAKRALSELENQTSKLQASAHPLGSKLAEFSEPAVERWGPAEIDERVPPVLSNANCPLPQILKETSDRTQDLIENLQRFSANEHIEQTDTDKNGKKQISKTEEMNYVVQIEQNTSGFPVVQEYRSGTGGVHLASVADFGTPAFALIFHPTHIDHFNFRCEGLTELRGSPAWQLHFEENADPNKSFIAIRIGRSSYLPRFKGRAWIATSSYNVLQIETDLVSPIPEIALELEHMVIEYAPVVFQKHRVELWLPESSSMYLAYRGHRYERTHSFSGFQLFSVDSTEAIKEPAAGKYRFSE